MSITFEDFTKVELAVATIIEAKPHPNATKLLVLKVNLGDEERQIVAGIKQFYLPEELVGKQIVIVKNLEPRELRGEMSHGMLLAASNTDSLSLVTVDTSILAGSKVG